MEAKIILGRILQRLIDQGYAQVAGYNRFGFVALEKNSITVSRENGEDTPLPFSRILKCIVLYQEHPELYDQGPNALRPFGVTHLDSPLFALLHLMEPKAYESLT